MRRAADTGGGNADLCQHYVYVCSSRVRDLSVPDHPMPCSNGYINASRQRVGMWEAPATYGRVSLYTHRVEAIGVPDVEKHRSSALAVSPRGVVLYTLTVGRTCQVRWVASTVTGTFRTRKLPDPPFLCMTVTVRRREHYGRFCLSKTLFSVENQGFCDRATWSLATHRQTR
jgi:hypothetical protein